MLEFAGGYLDDEWVTIALETHDKETASAN